MWENIGLKKSSNSDPKQLVNPRLRTAGLVIHHFDIFYGSISLQLDIFGLGLENYIFWLNGSYHLADFWCTNFTNFFSSLKLHFSCGLVFQEKGEDFFCYLDHPGWGLSYLLVKAILWSDEPSLKAFRVVSNQRSLHLVPTDFASSFLSHSHCDQKWLKWLKITKSGKK